VWDDDRVPLLESGRLLNGYANVLDDVRVPQLVYNLYLFDEVTESLLGGGVPLAKALDRHPGTLPGALKYVPVTSATHEVCLGIELQLLEINEGAEAT
jgi:hypothetical protein